MSDEHDDRGEDKHQSSASYLIRDSSCDWREDCGDEVGDTQVVRCGVGVETVLVNEVVLERLHEGEDVDVSEHAGEADEPKV